MTYDDVAQLALSLPGATMKMEFGPAPVFRVSGKLFLVITLDARGKPDGLWFKAGPQSFHILTKIKGIGPCRSMTRAYWVAMTGLKALKPAELKSYIVRAHALAAATLPKKTRAALGLPHDL